MRFILTGKCKCGADFSKDNQIKDIVLNEMNQMSFQCLDCKCHLLIETRWRDAVLTKTIAQQLDGQEVDETITDRVSFDPRTLIHTFDDLSQAKIIYRMVKCEPFQSKSLSTMSTKRVGYWSAFQ